MNNVTINSLSVCTYIYICPYTPKNGISDCEVLKLFKLIALPILGPTCSLLPCLDPTLLFCRRRENIS